MNKHLNGNNQHSLLNNGVGHMPGVGLMVRVVGLGSKNPDFKSPSAVELLPGGVGSARHPSEVGKMSASLLVSCVGVVTCPGVLQNSKTMKPSSLKLCMHTKKTPSARLKIGCLGELKRPF